MSVQGIISGALLKQCLLWPGTRNLFWGKVEEGGSKDYQYEKKLWDDGAQGLKKIVENENDLKVAMGLLRGLKVVQPLGTESAEQDEDYFCPDLVPPHKRRVTDRRSLDATSCHFWQHRHYVQVPFGFWDTLFMELRRRYRG